MTTQIIVQPAFYFAVRDDGALEHVGEWFRHVLLTEDLLRRADGRRIILGDGTIVFRCTNGGARYALSASTVPGVHQGRLVASWE